MYVLSRSGMLVSLQLYGMQFTRLFCPWNFPGKNIGVCCHSLLQRTFPTQRSNSHLLCHLQRQVDSLPLVPPGKPHITNVSVLFHLLLLYDVMDIALRPRFQFQWVNHGSKRQRSWCASTSNLQMWAYFLIFNMRKIKWLAQWGYYGD